MLSAPVNSFRARFCAPPAVAIAARISKRCESCILAASKKVVWVQTTNQAVLTAAVESGYSHALFTQETQQLAEQWAKLATFESLLVLPDGVIQESTKRQVIPAENLVAACQSSAGQLLGVACSAAAARVMLEALELGTTGVLLRTQDPLEPGEGLLVGSFARALFLVHSECLESQYINSRPFRINAGAVHAYVQAPSGRTAYLSELYRSAQQCNAPEVIKAMVANNCG
eukprot:gene2936-3222_t